MKRIFISIVMALVFCASAFAGTNPSVNFNGKNYVLKYSAKMPTGAYMNEYYLPAEKYNNWTKLIGVFDYPNIKDPIAAAKVFFNKTKSKDTPGQIWVNEKKNAALVSFMIFTDGKDGAINVEVNYFKYEKSPENGTIALQFAERLVTKTDADFEKFKTYATTQLPKTVNLMTNTPIPKIVERDIDLGK